MISSNLIKSLTYNNGKYLELYYDVLPPNGNLFKTSVIIDTTTGQVINVNKNTLIPDLNSLNKFKVNCCSVDETEIEECEGWSTEDLLCWSTEDGDTWDV